MAPRYRQSRRSSYQNRTSRATNFPRRKISPLFYVLVCAIVLVCILYGGYSFFPNVFNFDNDKYHKNETSSIDVNLVKSQELSIHFLELGNKVDGDCTLVKAGNTEVLIDAGSDESSITTIKNYIDQYIEDNVLEYIIVTHAHKDHYAGFATDEDEISLFDIYDIETVIQFAQVTDDTTTNQIYQNYLREISELQARCGTNVYTAQDCIAEINGAQKKYQLNGKVELEILNHRYYRETSSTENNHSVCCQIIQNNEKYFLFTGDLEAEGEASLIEENNLHPVELYKAGHHGSKTSSTDALLSVIQPKNIGVNCCAGAKKYNFPTQDFIDRVSKYTSNVYITLAYVESSNSFCPMNGNIVFYSNTNDTEIKLTCSNNLIVLKNTEWFSRNRKMPQNWLCI